MFLFILAEMAFLWLVQKFWCMLEKDRPFVACLRLGKNEGGRYVHLPLLHFLPCQQPMVVAVCSSEVFSVFERKRFGGQESVFPVSQVSVILLCLTVQVAQ